MLAQLSETASLAAVFKSLNTRNDVATSALLWGIRLGIVLLFLTPAIVTTSTVFPFIVGKAVWYRSLIEIIVGLYVLLAVRAPKFRPFRNLLVLFFGLHLAALIVAGYFGSSFNLSFWSSYERMGGILDTAHWVALVGVLVFTVRGLREWKILVGLYLAVSWIPTGFALIEIFGIPFPGNIPTGFSPGRIAGLAGNPTFLSGQMMINAMLALAFFVDAIRSYTTTRRTEVLAIAGLSALTAAVSLWVLSETGTRGSMIGLFAGLMGAVGVYAMFSRRSRVRLVLTITGAAVPIALVLLFVGRDTAAVQELAARNTMVDRIVGISLDGGGFESRTAGLRIAGRAFLARPVTGWGGENFEVPYQRYQRAGEFPESAPILDRAHNKPLDLLATSGFIGFATYMTFWGWLGFLGLRRIRSEPENSHFHALIAGALVALFINNLFLFDTPTTLLVLALLATWTMVGQRQPVAREGTGSGVRWLPEPVRQPAMWALPVVVGIVVVVGVYGINWRIYKGAQLITETGSSVEEVIENIDHFPPLGTFARERLLNVMSTLWTTLDPDNRASIVPTMGEQADIALAAEPDNMQLHFAVARFYRTVASDSNDLLARARVHTDKGVSLGPNTESAARALREQTEAESAEPKVPS